MEHMRWTLLAGAASVALGVILSSSCGSKEDDKTTSTNPTSTASSTSTTVSFADANTVIKAKCAASGCHGKSGAGSSVYEDAEAKLTADKAKCVSRVNSTSIPMPPAGSPALTATEKSTILSFCGG